MRTAAAIFIFPLALLAAGAQHATAAPMYDIVYLLDESGSIDATEFNQEKNFAVQSANSFIYGANDTASSLILHGNSSRLIINMTPNRPSFINATNGTARQGGNSNFTAGFTAAQNQFATFGRPDAFKIIAVVGDGPANVDTANLVPKLDELAAQGVHIFSISVPQGDHSFMQGLVRNSGQWYLLSSFSEASAAFVRDVFVLLNTTPGDYNANGNVDAADYAVWRNQLGTAGYIPNDTTPGSVSAADYSVWRANFGNTVLVGAANNSNANAAIPEPATWMMLLSSTACAFVGRRTALTDSANTTAR